MNADTSTPTGSRDEVPNKTGKTAGPNHTPAVAIGGIGSTAFVGLLTLHTPYWTGCATWKPPAILSMILVVAAGVCFVMAAILWTGSNDRHQLRLIEARQARIEEREDARRAAEREDIASMELRFLQALTELGEKMTEVKRQQWYAGYGSGYEDRGLHDSGKPPAKVVPMAKRLAPRPLDLQA